MRHRFLALLAGALLALVWAGVAAAEPPGQTAGQAAGSSQTAAAASGAAQVAPSNTAISVRILSPGGNGSVTQANGAASNAVAGNANTTGQSAAQTGGSGGMQSIGQGAGNDQAAAALSNAVQIAPSNNAIDVRVLSPGTSGSVSQANGTLSNATAANGNKLDQGAQQTQAGCGCSGGGNQSVGQGASNDQHAAAVSHAAQVAPSNTAASVRILSPGDDGDVKQANIAASNAGAVNLNSTGQSAAQTGGSGGSQSTGQSAGNDQHAAARSGAEQVAPSNKAVNVRVLSPGSNGSVSQSNVAASNATAANANKLDQSAEQTQAGCGCSAGGQSVGQIASNKQGALALSGAKQIKPSNTASSVRVLSPGDDGDVKQANIAASNATALNANGTTQSATQTGAPASERCGCSGPYETAAPASEKCGCSGPSQTIGQAAGSKQAALGASGAFQAGASNSANPVRIGSHGDDGSTTQINAVLSKGTAVNGNRTSQTATQTGSGPGTQAVGQLAGNEQLAIGLSHAAQLGASNEASPVRIGSHGDGGHVKQANIVASKGTAVNLNGLSQDASQTSAAGKCGCGGGIQGIGQSSWNSQAGIAGSAAAQLGSREPCGCGSLGNRASPVRVGSPGNDGSTAQANLVLSNATALNLASTGQSAQQTAAGGGPYAVQAIGQEAKSKQAALALSFALQAGASNVASPVRIGSPGGGGSVAQLNAALSNAKAANLGGTRQSSGQTLGRGCGCGGLKIQATGQSAWNEQLAFGLSKTLQLYPSNVAAPVAIGGHGDRKPIEKKRDGDAKPVAQANDGASGAGSLNGDAATQAAKEAA